MLSLWLIFGGFLIWGNLYQISAYKKDVFPVDKNTTMNQLMDGFKEVDITASDGITIKSIVFDPEPSSSNGKNPVIIFISSWGMNKWEYVVPANEYAKKGYTVISYTSRGFWESGGEINLAGPKDMADVTTVISWSLTNTRADPDRVGLSGISYGGGISILATAFDSRIKSVAAMSCWVDLAESFLGNGESIRKEAVRILDVLAVATGELSADLKTLFDDYFNNKDLQFLYDFTKNSSAVNYIPAINANKPAIFIANAYGDSLFTPNQFPSFWNALSGNKHLEFAPGDHAGPELPGILGLPDQVWTRAGQWNDYYVRDAKTDTYTGMPSVVLNTINGDEVESYDSWEAVTNTYGHYQLNKDEQLTEIQSISDDHKKALLRSVAGMMEPVMAKRVITAVGATATELVTITTGDNAHIQGGIAFVTATVRSYLDQPLRYEMKEIKRKHGAVFETGKLPYSLRVRGVPQLSLNFIPKTSSSGTFIVYILDVDNLTNQGKLVTFSPWTFKNVTPGVELTLSMDLSMTSYNLAAGNHLAVVISTRDMLFMDQSPEDVQITFTAGSVLSVPLHA